MGKKFKRYIICYKSTHVKKVRDFFPLILLEHEEWNVLSFKVLAEAMVFVL